MEPQRTPARMRSRKLFVSGMPVEAISGIPMMPEITFPRYMDITGFPSFWNLRKMDIPAKKIPFKTAIPFPSALPPAAPSKTKSSIPTITQMMLTISAFVIFSFKKIQARTDTYTGAVYCIITAIADVASFVEILKQ